MESVLKHRESAESRSFFGILKGRLGLLRFPVIYRNRAHIDHEFFTCSSIQCAAQLGCDDNLGRTFRNGLGRMV